MAGSAQPEDGRKEEPGLSKKNYTTDEKYQWVLAILRNESSLAELARRHGVSRTSLENWREHFLSGGRQALEASPERDGENEPCSRKA